MDARRSDHGPPDALLRIAVIFLASIETLLAASFIALMLQSTDPLGKAIGEGMTRLLAMPLVLLVLPALALGLANKWLPAAMAMVLVAIPIALLLWRLA